MEQHNIKWINTLSYSPQSNGLIENFNNQLRKMLREIMIRNKSLVWYNKLDLCCSIKNKQKNGTTKQRPIDIWNDLPYETQNKDLHLPVAQRIKAKAKKNRPISV
jgi:transposase InsO family protein